ncbi:hypothetical protein LOZ36_004677 [Ophidiomyces ophidiicola]|nr:hypothetical protein LOZ36_004677 [Ophidiomyces ophidiicola]
METSGSPSADPFYSSHSPRRQLSSRWTNISSSTPGRPSSTSPVSRSPETRFSRQNRRLRLRHAGFRGGLITSTQPIAPQFATWRSLSGGAVCGENKDGDGSVKRASGQTHWNHDSTSNASYNSQKSIVLQEVQNLTQRRNQHPSRPLVSTIFQDEPVVADSIPGPFYNSSRPKTPLLEPFSPEPAMKPKDTSLSMRKSSFASIHRQKRQNSFGRTISHGTSRYIEHLESQLASIHHTESSTSPAGNKCASKYKALNAEHKVLKQELLEWEEQFETRVKDELALMVDRESQLRSKLRTLEREVETKDNKIRELEWEAEMDRQRLRNLEAVNSTNRSLERRVDVLTGLLAQSPGRPESDSRPSAVSDDVPSADEPVRRTPRPKSMFSRIPLSPVRQPVFQPLVASDSNAQAVDTGLNATSEIPELDIDYQKEPDEEKPASEFGDLDSGMGDSCSLPSSRFEGSQRLSMISYSSSSSLWGTSFPLPLELPRRPRRMRRFPSGSCTLKPLILPATSSLLSPSSPNFHPISSSFYPSSHSRTHSTNDWHSPSDPMHVHDETLSALEEYSDHFQSFEEAMSGHSLPGIEDVSGDDEEFHSSPDLSLFTKDRLHPPGFFETPTRDPSSSPDPLKKLPSFTTTGGSRSTAAMTVIQRGSYRQPRRRLDQELSPGSEDSPLTTKHVYLANRIADITLKDASNCSHWFRDIISGSIILARRIISRAWHSNWKRIGKLPWWVLGLILGVQRRNDWFKRYARDQTMWLSLYRSPSATSDGFEGTQDYTGYDHSILQTPPRTRLSIQELTRGPKLDSSGSERNEQGTDSYEVAPLRLWAKFSLAIALAIGLAIKDGPASLMCSCASTPDDPDCPFVNKRRFYPIIQNESRMYEDFHSGEGD